MFPMQKGDVYTTYADTNMLEKKIGYKGKVSLSEGIEKIIGWYKEYFVDFLLDAQ